MIVVLNLLQLMMGMATMLLTKVNEDDTNAADHVRAEADAVR